MRIQQMLRLMSLMLLTGCGLLSMTTELTEPVAQAELSAENKPAPTVAVLLSTGATPSPAPTDAPSTDSTSTPRPQTAAPNFDGDLTIEIANQSGVSGYEIGIFGVGFGDEPGRVTVLEADATVLEWEDGFVQAVVPDVADGDGELIIVALDGSADAAPFSVYTIDPQFLEQPEPFYKDVIAGKPVEIEGLEVSYCNKQPSNANMKAENFLTDFQCGFDGIVGAGSATFSADSTQNLTATLTVDTEQTLAGVYYFQFYVNGDWYPRLDEESFYDSYPRDYSVQVSADGTTWENVVRVMDNQRATRTHRFEVAAEAGYRLVRLVVTDGITDRSDAAGRDFALREIRLFEEQPATAERPYAFGLYGDSLTTTAFELKGTDGFAGQVSQQSGSEYDLMTTVFGVIGKDTTGIQNLDWDNSDIYDAMNIDDNATRLRYWGIALGTNDSRGPEETIQQEGTSLGDFGVRLDDITRTLIEMGRVPMIARIPDTDAARDGYGTPATKAHILREIDRVNAEYRLVPGPDFYTPFRRNIETDDGFWLGNDGSHHTDAGRQMLTQLWAEAFVRAVFE